MLKTDPDVFDDIPDGKRKELLSLLKEIIHIEISESSTRKISGPFPPPDILEHYIRVAPDFAERIKQMALEEQKYAHNRDNKLIQESFKLKQRGQYFAGIIAVFAISGGVICILNGFEVAGTIVSGVGLSGLVSEFLGRSRDKKTA